MMDQLQSKAVNAAFIDTVIFTCIIFLKNKFKHFIEFGDHNSNWIIDKHGYFQAINEFIKKANEHKQIF